MISNFPKGWTRFFLILGWAYAAFLLYFILFRYSGYSFDFRGYYEAAGELFQSGLNPYTRPWFYASAPMTLNLYRPFLDLTLSQGGLLFMLLKMIAYIGIFRLWNRYFVPLDWKDPFTLWFFILAFNGALHYDIISGNVSGFLQMLLWCAFAALLSGRIWLFCALVVAAAEIKPDLLPFLGILVLMDKKPRWRPFFAALAAFAAIYSLNHLFYGELMQDFYATLIKVTDYNRGVNNPSTMAFLRDYWSHMQHRYPIPDQTADVCFLLIVAGVLISSFVVYQRYRRAVKVVDNKVLILFLCVIFGILTPRIPPYLYALMLIPTLYLLKVFGMRMAVPLAAVIVMLPHGDTSFPRAVVTTFHWVYIYIQLFGLYLVWYFYLIYFQTQTINGERAHVSK